MIERKQGRIVNIASASGQIGLGAIDCAVYGGTKGGVIAPARALAWELWPVRHNGELRFPRMDRAGKR